MPTTSIEGMIRTISMLAVSLGKRMNDDETAFYVQGIDDVPFDKFDLAVSKIRRESRWMPSPAEFREAAMGRKSRIAPLQRKTR